MERRTMATLGYGFSTPEDLFEKLGRDGSKLGPEPHKDEVFNFLVTATALFEWVQKIHSKNELVCAVVAALAQKKWELLPLEAVKWISDDSCIPNTALDFRRHIYNALQICWSFGSASKHFKWEGKVKAIEADPIIDDWYKYFFTSTAPDLYIDYAGEHYGLSQVRDIVTQFYRGLLGSLGPKSSK